ncbi:MAG: hypothetical protein K5681_08830 [Treponema sp.]|nr:hypothetical protein [Treponema sp.]
MKQTISYKKFFINYGIFVGILAVLLGILIYTSKITQKSWSKNLKKNIETVLEEAEPSSWVITNNIKIKNAFTLNAACYDARNKKNGKVYKAIIINTQTLYGPIPAVFTVDNNGEVKFIGYSSVHGRVKTQLLNDSSNKRIKYWIKKIPYIIEQ